MKRLLTIGDKWKKNSCYGCDSTAFGLWYGFNCCDNCHKSFKGFTKFIDFCLNRESLKLVSGVTR